MFILDYFVAPVFSLIPVSAIMLDKLRNLKKRLLIPILHMFACLVSIYTAKFEFIQQQTSCLHQRLVSLVRRGSRINTDRFPKRRASKA